MLDTELPGVLLDEYTLDPVAAVETKILDPNAIAADADDNSGISNITGVYDNSNAPTPIFTINSTSEAEPNDGNEDKDDDDNEDYDDGNVEVEELELP